MNDETIRAVEATGATCYAASPWAPEWVLWCPATCRWQSIIARRQDLETLGLVELDFLAQANPAIVSALQFRYIDEMGLLRNTPTGARVCASREGPADGPADARARKESPQKGKVAATVVNKRFGQNREAWLLAAMPALHKLATKAAVDAGLTILDRPVPYVSVGWPKGARGKAIGQCWLGGVDGERAHLFLSPVLEDGCRVLDVLLHEIVHDLVGNVHGHKKPFGRLARACGLEGRLTATVAGEDLRAKLETIVKRLGHYPHIPLADTTGAGRQKCRQRKWVCPSCGQIIRAASDDLEVTCVPCDAEFVPG